MHHLQIGYALQGTDFDSGACKHSCAVRMLCWAIQAYIQHCAPILLLVLFLHRPYAASPGDQVFAAGVPASL